MKKLTILLVFASFLVISCSRDNDESIENSNVAPILPRNKTVEVNGVVTSSSDYTYQDNKIISIDGTSPYGFWKEVYTYDNDLIISNITYAKYNLNDDYYVSNERYYTYYNTGKVKTLMESRPGIGTIDKSEYTYGQSSVCVTSSINTAGEEFPHSIESLTYSNNNLMHIDADLYNYSTNSYGPVNIVKNILYDNKNCITKNILGFNKLIYNSKVYSLENNPTISNGIITDENGNSENFFRFHYTYVYNNNNYPIIKYVLDDNNNITKTIYITY